MSLVSIRSTIRTPTPKVPYEELTRRVLGNKYELSLVLCGDWLARAVNKKYRQKTYAANVLSFPLSKVEGEIFLNLRVAAREARRHNVSYTTRVALLFVHALYHLKGLKHSDATEKKEQQVLREFGF